MTTNERYEYGISFLNSMELCDLVEYIKTKCYDLIGDKDVKDSIQKADTVRAEYHKDKLIYLEILSSLPICNSYAIIVNPLQIGVEKQLGYDKFRPFVTITYL